MKNNLLLLVSLLLTQFLSAQTLDPSFVCKTEKIADAKDGSIHEIVAK